MENIVKKFGDKVVLNSINIDIADGELLVFVGPSGCGKTTAMRCISGLEEVTSGKIYIGDTVVNNMQAKDRDVAMVFQNYALYPYMKVYDNIAFGLRARKILSDKQNPKSPMRKYRAEEIDERVKKAAKMLEISDLLNRKPSELSGGQMQRVAMGRAIVREPQVYMMDEPLSNLDAKLRAHMRTELKRLQIELGVTTIYVTHDQAEAMTLGDRVAVMYDGIFQQIGTPEEVYDRPVNKFVGGFIGSPEMNFISGKLEINGEFIFSNESFKISIPQKTAEIVQQRTTNIDDLIFGIRPEDLEDKEFALKADSEAVTARVLVRENYGSDIFLNTLIGGNVLISARVNTKTEARVGKDIDLIFDLDKIHFFDIKTEKNLTLSV